MKEVFKTLTSQDLHRNEEELIAFRNEAGLMIEEEMNYFGENFYNSEIDE